jgi:hypothetical protein
MNGDIQPGIIINLNVGDIILWLIQPRGDAISMHVRAQWPLLVKRLKVPQANAGNAYDEDTVSMQTRGKEQEEV